MLYFSFPCMLLRTSPEDCSDWWALAQDAQRKGTVPVLHRTPVTLPSKFNRCAGVIGGSGAEAPRQVHDGGCEIRRALAPVICQKNDKCFILVGARSTLAPAGVQGIRCQGESNFCQNNQMAQRSCLFSHAAVQPYSWLVKLESWQLLSQSGAPSSFLMGGAKLDEL